MTDDVTYHHVVESRFDFSIFRIKVCLEIPLNENSSRPVDTGLKLSVCKMFR